MSWDEPVEWDPKDCDGCSVPAPLRFVFPRENDRQTYNCCCPHDQAYFYGGEEIYRLLADQKLYYCLVGNGFSVLRAWLYFRAVRWFGGEDWREWNPKAWGYGRRLDAGR